MDDSKLAEVDARGLFFDRVMGRKHAVYCTILYHTVLVAVLRTIVINWHKIFMVLVLY